LSGAPRSLSGRHIPESVVDITEMSARLPPKSLVGMGRNPQFLSAMKTLALVRRLGLPAVQVNIGEKQVNVV